MPVKIVIIGASASGKSTFARKLAAKTDLPLIHMDSIMWKPGWKYVGDDVTNQKLSEEAQKPSWIIEGYITQASRAGLFEIAEQIIYLDYSGWRIALQYFKRTIAHRRNSRPELPGSPDSFSFKFLWLVFTKGEAKDLEKLLTTRTDWGTKLVRLSSPFEANKFIES